MRPAFRTAAEDLASLVPDGAFLALPPDYSMPAMAVVRALVLEKKKNLKLLGVPVLGMCADLLIGAGCVREVESSAVSLGEAGLAPRFSEAAEKGEIVVRDATCPAVHTALQASEKGVPFMPLRGILGSELLDGRDDWKVLQNPFAATEDPILYVRAIAPDIALSTRTGPTKRATSGSAGAARLATIAHAARQTFVAFEELRAGDMLEDELLAPGVISATYISAAAPAKRGAWPLGVAGVYGIDDAHLAHYARAARTRGFQRYLEEYVCTPEESSPASSPA